MVKALTTSMMIDSTLILFSSPHPLAEVHISNRPDEKGDCHYQPDHILHIRSPDSPNFKLTN
jgi:hypothetical protein